MSLLRKKKSTTKRILNSRKVPAPKKENYIIRLATPEDADLYFEYNLRHFSESGNNDLIFTPTEDMSTWKRDENVKALKDRWGRPATSDFHWERAWILVIDEKIVGAAGLRTSNIPASRHRASFFIGIEKPFRGKGFGKLLIEKALGWARAQENLIWIDLYVFTFNERARSLYYSFGFSEVGTTKDIFRLKDQSIDDVHMVLKLR